MYCLFSVAYITLILLISFEIPKVIKYYEEPLKLKYLQNSETFKNLLQNDSNMHCGKNIDLLLKYMNVEELYSKHTSIH